MNKTYWQMDQDFRILTKFILQFLVNYTNLYGIYEFALETKLKNVLQKGRTNGHNSAQQPMQGCGRASAGQPNCPTTRARPCILQKSPRLIRVLHGDSKHDCTRDTFYIEHPQKPYLITESVPDALCTTVRLRSA